MANERIEAPFAAEFPLPFRVLVLIGLGILCWATNLHGLKLLNVDVASALDLRAHDDSYLPRLRLTTSPHAASSSFVPYKAVYRLFLSYVAVSLAGWTLFRLCSQDKLALVDTCKFVPAVLWLSILMIVVSPFAVMQKAERDRFLV